MSGEERVSVARHALLFESRLNDSLETQGNKEPRIELITRMNLMEKRDNPTDGRAVPRIKI
jgi:hypothetical protein